ncbi:Uncharacterised protein [Vibrio cholerae]|nr:Uncharacterised protein [Vibrio cholerae]
MSDFSKLSSMVAKRAVESLIPVCCKAICPPKYSPAANCINTASKTPSVTNPKKRRLCASRRASRHGSKLTLCNMLTLQPS